MDRFTETTYTSYGQNIGNSFKGILLGFLFLIASIVLLWWNEGRSVDQANALEEMQTKITTLHSAVYDPSVDGKAVLVQGEVKPRDVVMDTQFEVKTDGLVLQRKVEMYQWKESSHSESKEKLGGGTETVTTYEYHKTWSASPISSGSFRHRAGHENPPMNYHSATFSTEAKMGDFYLDKGMVDRIPANYAYDGLAQMPEKIGMVKNYKTFLYIGDEPSSPAIGDVKITYYYAPSGMYTYAAKESGKALVPYISKNGRQLVFVRSGKVEAQTIFKEEFENNTMITWVLRIVGLSVMFVAFSMLMGPLQAFAKVIPLLGSLAGGVTGIVAAILTLVLGSFVIALAWFSSRPILSLSIIGVAMGIALLLGKFGKKKTLSGETRNASSPESRSSPPPGGTPVPPERKKEKEASISQPPLRRRGE
jgi:hypothetical protein